MPSSHRKAAAGFRRELAGFADAKDTHYAGAPLPRTRLDPKQSIPSTNRPPSLFFAVQSPAGEETGTMTAYTEQPPSRRQGTLPARRNDR